MVNVAASTAGGWTFIARLPLAEKDDSGRIPLWATSG